MPRFISIPLLIGLWTSQISAAGQSLDLLYKGGIDNFYKLQIQITPYNQSIYYSSYGGKRFTMDCDKTEKPLVWRCLAPCESGPIEIHFSKSQGFQKVQIKSLDFIPRACDGSYSELDKPVKSQKPIAFQLKTISKEYSAKKKK